MPGAGHAGITVSPRSSHLLYLLRLKANISAVEGQAEKITLWSCVHGGYGHVWALIRALGGCAFSAVSRVVIAIPSKNLFLCCVKPWSGFVSGRLTSSRKYVDMFKENVSDFSSLDNPWFSQKSQPMLCPSCSEPSFSVFWDLISWWPSFLEI